jgi:hypothetical protein
MQRALYVFRKSDMCSNAAACTYGFPKATLKRRIEGEKKQKCN